ncbi:hypothetical protein C1I98_20310 [Spongiactinospora gelatinilytica]|uniref:Uncharacterized protein n=1 Tax=Spongiactinospora gelatinilytica TaxID=2666298 RepID=A0A2W2G214_9ACTN|nr:hypothetical protein [Spongiactinospora gelatinilytica]PZG42012.1 hypothetical protein C1I98_20310 [Spongiactinospora gelatinilytica]
MRTFAHPIDALDALFDRAAGRIPPDQLGELRLFAPLGMLLLALTAIGRIVTPWVVAGLPGGPFRVPLLFCTPLTMAELVGWLVIGGTALVVTVVLAMVCWMGEEHASAPICTCSADNRSLPGL